VTRDADKRGNLRKPSPRALALVAAVAAIVTMTMFFVTDSSGSEPVDNDPVAAARLSNGEKCPEGTLSSVTEWEKLASIMQEAEARFDLQGGDKVNMVDVYVYELVELPEDAPQGATAQLAICVETDEGMMDTGHRYWVADAAPAEGDE
jgi:hypothetical protein